MNGGEIFLIVLGSVVAPLLVAALLAIGKKLVDIEKVLARDDERWAHQNELWGLNQVEHDRAFERISELRKGQRGIEKGLVKIDMDIEKLTADIKSLTAAVSDLQKTKPRPPTKRTGGR